MSQLKEGDKVIFAGKTGTIIGVSENARFPFRVVLDSGGQGIYAESELKEAGEESYSPEQSKYSVSKLLADWIDPGVIANAIVGAMSEVAKPVPALKMTFENAKHIYYDFLEKELTDALKRSVQHIFRG